MAVVFSDRSTDASMPSDTLTPLRFTPIFRTALWGGSKLRTLFHAPPSDDPTGEAWVLSDQGENSSVVAEGRLAGARLRELIQQMPERILGRASLVNGRFPLLLKFLHIRRPLSVQVHPNDAKAREFEGPLASGKTEAWYIVEADPTASLYCGLHAGVTPVQMRRAIEANRLEELLDTHRPERGDCFLLPAGTVHALCDGLLVFEVQQTSDITYRLYDWGRVDPKTGKPRELHIEKGLACVNYSQGPCRPICPTDEGHGRVRLTPLVECAYFTLGRWDAASPFRAGEAGQCRMIVGVEGRATLRHGGKEYGLGVGDTWLLPAEVGACEVVPQGPVVILECSLV